MALINLKKISGTKRYKIISQKMFSVRFSVHSVAWFDSCLSIEVFRWVSKVNTLMLQILVPLLFLIYVNDSSQAGDCGLHFYTDDSCLVYQY